MGKKWERKKWEMGSGLILLQRLGSPAAGRSVRTGLRCRRHAEVLTSFEEPKWTLQYAVAGSLHLQQGYEGGGSIAEGATFSDGWVFYHQSRPGHTNGQVATQDEVFAAPPGSEFCLVCHPCHAWLTVFVPTSLLFFPPPELEFASCARPQLLRPSLLDLSPVTATIRRMIGGLRILPDADHKCSTTTLCGVSSRPGVSCQLK